MLSYLKTSTTPDFFEHLLMFRKPRIHKQNTVHWTSQDPTPSVQNVTHNLAKLFITSADSATAQSKKRKKKVRITPMSVSITKRSLPSPPQQVTRLNNSLLSDLFKKLNKRLTFETVMFKFISFDSYWILLEVLQVQFDPSEHSITKFCKVTTDGASKHKQCRKRMSTNSHGIFTKQFRDLQPDIGIFQSFLPSNGRWHCSDMRKSPRVLLSRWSMRQPFRSSAAVNRLGSIDDPIS